MKWTLALGFALLALLCLAIESRAATVGWTDWSTSTPSNGSTAGSASGVMTFGSNSVNVTYTGELDSNTETGGAGTNYISPLATYQSGTVANVPPGGNLITVTGGTAFTDTVTFSSPVHDFLMAFVSLGTPSTTVTYHFDTTSPISILSTGTGWWGGDVNLSFGHDNAGFDTITGTESDGIIQFAGDFSSISWTIPPPGEFWDGWTFGAVAQADVVPPTNGVPLPSSAAMTLVFLALGGTWIIARKIFLARRAV